MRLVDYWGVGPKTASLLEESLGTDRAIEAIESADVRAMVDAGVPSGRATRVLRRANGGAGMDVLATADTRSVYRDLLALAREFAVTERAEDRIRVLTPMLDREAMTRRLDRIEATRKTWRALDDETREAVVDAFSEPEAATSERAAVETARALSDLGVSEGVFEPIVDLPDEELRDAARALSALGERVEPGADSRLDTLREGRTAIETLRGNTVDVVESIREGGVGGSEEFREAYVEYVVGETGVDATRIRDHTPDGATDAGEFVDEALSALAGDIETALEEREAAVEADLRAALSESAGTVERATHLVSDLALSLSLARFAEAYELVRPTFTGNGVAVENARNLSLVASGAEVQSVTYGIGTHGIGGPPTEDRVTVVTGANSGGKTTLLETLCEVQLLAQMGLPVPAQRAEVSVFDAIVFHRRHASFNAGVLESTLRTVVPPLSDDGRTLMLVDEFEAITEPGSAANLLHGLVTLTVDRGALGVFVTHLADDLEPLPEEARVDGIFAEGLTTDLELDVDYQPRFETVGRSTPEFIVSRLVAGATDHGERAAFQTLATAVGEHAVQRTLLDAEWTED
ncbi:MutS-related protein [Natronorarus salvus]|uniref:MutS-related protein n=1 Tax=Natronorarus salvus TaxID=3117733 RepID=UPI002F26469B